MKKLKPIVLLIASLLLLSFHGQDLSSANSGVVIYVKSDAAGMENGTSWEDAFTDLHEALEVANPEDTIWVAAGTYKPAADNRDTSFQLSEGVTLLGGFSGNEVLLSERDWLTNSTILSGDIGTPGDSTDNSYHVLTGIDLSIATIDGFFIEKGFADGTGEKEWGGGLWVSNCQLRISNCLFRNNFAAQGGGAIYLYTSAFYLNNCLFESNLSEEGGAILAENAMAGSLNSPNMDSCQFEHNTARQGGAIRLLTEEDSTTYSLWWKKCTFTGNGPLEPMLSSGGGAIYNNTDAEHLFEECHFDGNFAKDGGAVTNENFGGTVRSKFVDCTFENNFTPISIANAGGAVKDGPGAAQTEYVNCIFKNNTANHGGGYAFLYNSSEPLFVNCIFEGNEGGGAYLECANGHFVNCLFYNNNIPGIATISCSNPVIENCIFWANGEVNIGSSNSNPLFRNCLLQAENCEELDFAQCEDVLFGKDPLFIQPDAGDFRLMICSPARNAGLTASVPEEVETDLMGNDRILDGQVDIGVFEFLDPTPQYRPTDVTQSADNLQVRSMRAAIICANELPGPDTIQFFPGPEIPFVMNPQIPLPALTDDSTYIDAGLNEWQTIVLDGPEEDEPGALTIDANEISVDGLYFRNSNVALQVINSSNNIRLSNNYFGNNQVSISLLNNSQEVTITNNSFSCNEIALDFAFGVNAGVPPPEISYAAVDSVGGTFNSPGSIQVFVQDTFNCENTVACQGYRYLGESIVDETGSWSLTAFNLPLEETRQVTALGTDTSGNTSIFAQCSMVTCPESTSMIMDDLCEGDSIIINGTVYNGVNPQGTEVIPGGSSIGCDSIIEVNLNIVPLPVFDLGVDTFILHGEGLLLDPGLTGENLTYGWSTGEETPTINANIGGYYSLTVTNEAGCSYTDGVDIIVDVSSLEKEHLHLSIFPNPVSETLQVLQKGEFAPESFIIYDLQGRQLLRFDSSGLALQKLEVSELPKGVYYLQARFSEGIFNFKFVKE